MKVWGIVIAAIALMTAVPAQAAPAGATVIEIKSVAFGKCLTAGADDFRLVDLADCAGTDDQRWERWTAPDGHVLLRNVADRQCIEGSGSVITEACDEKDHYQHWDFVSGAPGSVKLKMGVQHEAYADTSWYGEWEFKLFTEAPADSDHQRFQVTEVGTVPSRPDTTGALVTLENSERANHCATGTTMGGCPGSAFQRVELGGGEFQLRAGAVCLRPDPATRFDVDLRGNCAEADPAQRWRLEGPDVFGGYLLRNVGKGTYLTPLTGLQLFEKEPFGEAPQWQRWLLNLA